MGLKTGSTRDMGEVTVERFADEMRQQYVDAGMPEATAGAVMGMST